MKGYFYAVLLSLAALCFGCEEAKYAMETHTYQKENYDTQGTSLCTSINIQYITFNGEGAFSSINDTIKRYVFLGINDGEKLSSAMYDAWEEQQKEDSLCVHEEEADTVSSESEDIYVASPWYYNCTVECPSAEKGRVSLIIKHSTNSPFVTTVSPIYMTLSAVTGKKIKSEDVFSDVLSVQNIITEQFIKEDKLQAGIPLTEQGIGIGVDVLPMTDDFVFTADGIVFHYPILQMAPLAQNREEILVPFNLLEGLLK